MGHRGAERYASLAPLYYRGGRGGGGVRHNITRVLREGQVLGQGAAEARVPNINIVLVGNKKDWGESGA